MIKIGDRVKFLNDVGGGIVTGFIGKNMANVQNEDGFDMPYPVSKLINVDDPTLNKPTSGQKNKQEEKVPEVRDVKVKGQIIQGKDSPDFYFCIVPSQPNNPLAGNIDLFLVNDSNYSLLFHYAHYRNGQYKTVFHGLVAENSRTNLESIGLSDLNELPEYAFHLIYFRNDDKKLNPAVMKKFRINPVKFYKERSFQSNPFFPGNAMIFQISEDILNTEIDKLTEDDFRKVVKSKENRPDDEKPQKQDNPDVLEVDLHIHELIENTKGLSNKEILEVQMEKVEREMRAAVQSQVKRIIFIHGVGQGVLKQEIARLLSRKFPKYTFQDASYREYGYGATMVVLRRK